MTGGQDRMNCPYLKHTAYFSSANANTILACKVHDLRHVPSIMELDIYCRNRRHTVSPFYLYDRKDHPEVTMPPGP